MRRERQLPLFWRGCHLTDFPQTGPWLDLGRRREGRKLGWVEWSEGEKEGGTDLYITASA